jgi:hypothetical protein
METICHWVREVKFTFIYCQTHITEFYINVSSFNFIVQFTHPEHLMGHLPLLYGLQHVLFLLHGNVGRQNELGAGGGGLVCPIPGLKNKFILESRLIWLVNKIELYNGYTFCSYCLQSFYFAS